jgi:Transposase
MRRAVGRLGANAFGEQPSPGAVTVPELSRLARTVRTWEAEILAFHSTNGCSNGPTEALNLLIKKVKRVGHGFRNSPTTGYACCCTAASGGRLTGPRDYEAAHYGWWRRAHLPVSPFCVCLAAPSPSSQPTTRARTAEGGARSAPSSPSSPYRLYGWASTCSRRPLPLTGKVATTLPFAS